MDVDPIAPERRLRIAVLADFEGVHARAWLRWPVERGHDVHAVSFYPLRAPLDGVTVHVLRQRATAHGASPAAPPPAPGRGLVPAGLLRLAHGARYRFAGLRRVLRDVAPDVVHAHYVVEHGFYGALAGLRPYVVTAWGSDILVEPDRDPVSKLIARWTLRRADLVTSNNRYMAERIVALGVPADKVRVITLGADREFLERHDESVNVRGRSSGAPCVLSTRAHEPLYNVADIIDAFGQVAHDRPGVRLAVAHGGSLTESLRSRAAETGGRIEFLGTLDRAAFRDALADAEVFVSVPSSDGTSVALLQAMAAGCFPIVSDLPTQRELVEDGVTGFRVPVHDTAALAAAIGRALDGSGLRRRAADHNRRLVEERGLNEKEMARMEELYLALCRRR